MPHFHVSGLHVVGTTFLAVVAMFGAAHLFAASHPDNEWSQAWTNGLGF